MNNRFSFRSHGVACWGGVLVALAASSALAGTIRHDRPDQAYRDRAALPQFASVGSYSTGSLFGSITLIAPDWALTAAHVVDTDADGLVSDELLSNDTVRFGAISRGVTELFVPTGVNGNPGWNGSINSGFDIALVHLASPVTTIAPAPIYAGFQELGKTITTVGFGQSGTGKTGAYLGTGTKRAGDNVFDQYVTFANGATALRYDFDEPPTDGTPRVSPNNGGSSTPLDLEYMIAPGDSGGGTFLFDQGAWHLAGVTSGLYDLFNYPNTTTDGATYGDAALITRVSAYQQFLYGHIPTLAAAVVPEPASLAAVVVAAIALLSRRRRA